MADDKAKQKKQDRLAQQLRANLIRRKKQMKERRIQNASIDRSNRRDNEGEQNA